MAAPVVGGATVEAAIAGAERQENDRVHAPAPEQCAEGERHKEQSAVTEQGAFNDSARDRPSGSEPPTASFDAKSGDAANGLVETVPSEVPQHKISSDQAAPGPAYSKVSFAPEHTAELPPNNLPSKADTMEVDAGLGGDQVPSAVHFSGNHKGTSALKETSVDANQGLTTVAPHGQVAEGTFPLAPPSEKGHQFQEPELSASDQSPKLLRAARAAKYEPESTDTIMVDAGPNEGAARVHGFAEPVLSKTEPLQSSMTPILNVPECHTQPPDLELRIAEREVPSEGTRTMSVESKPLSTQPIVKRADQAKELNSPTQTFSEPQNHLTQAVAKPLTKAGALRVQETGSNSVPCQTVDETPPKETIPVSTVSDGSLMLNQPQVTRAKRDSSGVMKDATLESAPVLPSSHATGLASPAVTKGPPESIRTTLRMENSGFSEARPHLPSTPKKAKLALPEDAVMYNPTAEENMNTNGQESTVGGRRNHASLGPEEVRMVEELAARANPVDVERNLPLHQSSSIAPQLEYSLMQAQMPGETISNPNQEPHVSTVGTVSAHAENPVTPEKVQENPPAVIIESKDLAQETSSGKSQSPHHEEGNERALVKVGKLVRLRNSGAGPETGIVTKVEEGWYYVRVGDKLFKSRLPGSFPPPPDNLPVAEPPQSPSPDATPPDFAQGLLPSTNDTDHQPASWKSVFRQAKTARARAGGGFLSVGLPRPPQYTRCNTIVPSKPAKEVPSGPETLANSVCTSCQVKTELVPHPLLPVWFCRNCEKMYNSGPFEFSDQGAEEYCRWCGDGSPGRAFWLCDFCSVGFCDQCTASNLTTACYDMLVRKADDENWPCFLCDPTGLQLKGSVRGRPWPANKLQRRFRGRPIPPPFKFLNFICRDISLGRESVPIPVVNSVDSEPAPFSFVYTKELVESTLVRQMVKRNVSELPYCKCGEELGNGGLGLCGGDCDCGMRSGDGLSYDSNGRIVWRARKSRLIYECSVRCKCAMNCRNRVVQKGITIPLQVFKTDNGRGWGLETRRDILKGEFVGCYRGEVLTDSETEQRKPNDLYFLQMDMGQDGRHVPEDVVDRCSTGLTLADWEEPLVIDALQMGNAMRFANHSCEPNISIVHIMTEGTDPRLPNAAFFAIRDIDQGEELTWDYNYTFEVEGHCLSKNTCLCGAPSCRGKLMAQEAK